jgi:hypothetical protein
MPGHRRFEASDRSILDDVSIPTFGGRDENPFTEVLKQFGSGYLAGFTTFHTGDDPDNTTEAIARNIGHLLGFIGIVPGVQTLGAVAARGIFKTASIAARQVSGRITSKAGRNITAAGLKQIRSTGSAAARFRSFPMFASDVVINQISRTARKTGMLNASKFLKEGTLARDIIKGGAHLGVASSVSVWQEGVDAMAGAFVSGSLFGAGFRSIGTAIPHKLGANPGGRGAARPDFSTAFGADGTENQIRFLARTMSGAMFQGLPGTIAGAPVELQVYDYLLGAYFGGRELHRDQRQTLEVIGATVGRFGRASASRIIGNPEEGFDGVNGRKLWSDFPTGVQEELKAQATHLMGKEINPEAAPFLTAIGARGLTPGERVLAESLDRVRRNRAAKLVKDGFSPEEADNLTSDDYWGGSLFEVKTDADGGVLFERTSAQGTGEILTQHTATESQLRETRTSYESQIQRLDIEKGYVKNPTVKQQDAFDKLAGRFAFYLKTIDVELEARARLTPEEPATAREALEAEGEAKPPSDLERLAMVRSRQSERIRMAQELRITEDEQRKMAEVSAAVEDHNIPGSLVSPLRVLVNSIIPKDTSPDARQGALLDIIRLAGGSRRTSDTITPRTTGNVKGGFSGKGKGTPAGDGKDAAMRNVADYSITEVASAKPSSTMTTRDTLPRPVKGKPGVVMLARNGSLRGRELSIETKADIKDAKDDGNIFVVGDMPGVDEPYVRYLEDIGAKFTIYHSGQKARIEATPKVRKISKGSDSIDSYDRFVKSVAKRFRIDEKKLTGSSPLARSMRRTFIQTTDTRPLKQIKIGPTGKITRLRSLDGGKRTGQTTRRSFLDDVIDRVRKRMGIDTSVDAHEILGNQTKGNKIWDPDIVPASDPAVLAGHFQADSDGKAGRFPFTGEKDKGKIHILPMVVNDPREAAEIVGSYKGMLDAMQKKHPQMFSKTWGERLPSEIVDAEQLYFTEATDGLGIAKDTAKLNEYALLDMANRLVMLEDMVGNGHFTMEQMIEAELTGAGSFLLDPVAINKRMSLFATDEPRMHRDYVADLRDVGEDGMLNVAIVNSYPEIGGENAPGKNKAFDWFINDEGVAEWKAFKSEMDGSIFLRSDVWKRYTSFAGRDPRTTTQKGVISEINSPDGALLVKPTFAPAPEPMNTQMFKDGTHGILYDMSVKQRGMRRKYDHIYGKDGIPRVSDPKTGELIDPADFHYKISPEAFTTNTGVGSEKNKDLADQAWPVQVGKNLSTNDSGNDAVNSYNDLVRKSINGDVAISDQALDLHLANADIGESLNIESIGLNTIFRIMKGDQMADSNVYDAIARKMLRIAEEEPENFFSNEVSQEYEQQIKDFVQARSAADQIMQSGTRLTPAILEIPNLVGGMWNNVFRSYFLRRIQRPMSRGSMSLFARMFHEGMAAKFPNFKKGELLLDDGVKEKMIPWREDGPEIRLGDAWDQFQEAGGWKKAPAWMQDRMEPFGFRVPADNHGAGRVTKLRGFTGEEGYGAIFHAEDAFHMGGMDTDGDKAFIFFETPRAIKEAYRKNQDPFRERARTADGTYVMALRDLNSKYRDYAVVGEKGNPSKHPAGLVSAARVLGASQQSYIGNGLLGVGLNAANRSKTFQEWIDNTSSGVIRRGVNMEADEIGVYPQLAFEIRDAVARQRFKHANKRDATAEDDLTPHIPTLEEVVKYRTTMFANSRNDGRKEIGEHKTTIVNVAADASDYQRFLADRSTLGNQLLRTIERPNSRRVVVKYGSGQAENVTVRLSSESERNIDILAPLEYALMTKVDRYLGGRDDQFNPSTLESIVKDLASTIRENPALFRNSSNPWYRAAYDLSQMSQFAPRERSPYGEALDTVQREFDVRYNQEKNRKMLLLAARKRVGLPLRRYDKKAEQNFLTLTKSIDSKQARVLELQEAGKVKEAKELQKAVNSEVSRHKTAVRTSGADRKPYIEQRSQDALDITTVEMLLEEGPVALGVPRETLEKMSRKDLEAKSQPLFEIAEAIEFHRNAYLEMVAAAHREAKGEVVDNSTSLEQFQIALRETMEIIGPEYQRYAKLQILGTLRPQATDLYEYAPYAKIQKLLNKALKDGSGDAKIDGLKAELVRAQSDWYATNYTSMWSLTDIIEPSLVKEFFDRYNTLTSKRVSKLDQEAMGQLRNRVFGESVIIDALMPGANELASQTKTGDMANNVVTELLTKIPIIERLRIGHEFGGKITDPKQLELVEILVEAFEREPRLMQYIEDFFAGELARADTFERGASIEGMSMQDLIVFVKRVKDVSTLRGDNLWKMLEQLPDDPTAIKRRDYFFNPDHFDKEHLKFDPRILMRRRPVTGPDGKTLVFKEVKSFISTAGIVNKISSYFVSRVSEAKADVEQKIAARLKFLDAAAKDKSREKLLRMAIGIREMNLGSDAERREGSRSMREMEKMDKTGKRYHILEENEDGEIVSRSVKPSEMVNEINKAITEELTTFYRNWVGDETSADGLTDRDRKTIVWLDEQLGMPDVQKTMEKLEKQVLRGHRPDHLTLNAIYKLTHRHMMDNLRVKRNPVSGKQMQLVGDHIFREEGFQLNTSSGNFNYGIYRTQTYKDWALGKFRFPKELDDAFKEIQSGGKSVRLGDLAPGERDAAENDVMGVLSVTPGQEKLHEKLTYKKIGAVDFASYWPRNGHPRKFLREKKKERMERLMRSKAGPEELLQAEVEFEIQASLSAHPSAGADAEVANMFLFNTLEISQLEEVGGIGYRPGHALARAEGEGLPGYSRDLTAIQRYTSQMVKANLQTMMSLINSHVIKRFEKDRAAGENTNAWAKFLKIYNRDSIGAPSIFPREWLNDPRLKLTAAPYWMFTDEYWVNKMKKKQKQYGFKSSMTLGQKSFLAKRMANWSRLEGQYELLTLLSRTKSGIANMFGGSTNTWVQNGRKPFFNARSLKYLQTHVNPKFKSMKDAEDMVARSGAIESFLADDFQFSPSWDVVKDRGFIDAVTNIFSKKSPSEVWGYNEGTKATKKRRGSKDQLWAEIQDLGDQYGVADKLLSAGSYFMRKTERMLRRDAWLASYIRAREVLNAGGAEDTPSDHPWLFEMANRGVETSQFLYNNANRPAFARTSMGKIFSRFQIWGWKSIKMRRDIHVEAREAGYQEGTEEFERLKRIMMADLLVVGLMKMFPFSIFDSATPPPMSWVVDMADWAYGSKEEKDSAFFGVGPTKILTPPAARPLEDIFRLMVNDDWDRFFDYHLWTYAPFGLMTRDLLKTYENPITWAERIGGIPLMQIQRRASGQEKIPSNPVAHLMR